MQHLLIPIMLMASSLAAAEAPRPATAEIPVKENSTTPEGTKPGSNEGGKGPAPNMAPVAASAVTKSPDIQVGTAKTKKIMVGMLPISSSSGGLAPSLGKTFREVLLNDLGYMDQFKFIQPDQFPAKTGSVQAPLAAWKPSGADIVIQTELSVNSNMNVILDVKVFDVSTEGLVLTQKYLGGPSEIKRLAHQAGNDIVQTLTRLPGIFLTKLAMSCDVNGHKEIYMMNIDGSNVEKITSHRSISFSPAWSPDGTRLAYSVYTRRNKIKNIDLYEFDFTSHSIRLLSNRTGINSGVSYAPDNTKLALTLSYQGNPEIYLMNRQDHTVNRITKSLGFDVDPAWSPDGQEIAFVSSRTGSPMVFTMKADGSNVQRITYAGKYNASPAWAPSGKKLVFAGWLDSHFDIFTVNSNGTHIERLTKGQGNNEDPVFSPDGNFIAFSSNRANQKNIYVMNTDGTFVRRLTYGLGNCVSPKWSTPPQAGVSDVQGKK